MNLDVDIQAKFTHRLRFTWDALDPDNATLLEMVRAAGCEQPARLLLFVDQGVLQAWPDIERRFAAYLQRHPGILETAGSMQAVPGAEPCKNDRGVLDDVLQAIHDARLCRRSFVVVIGGGAVLDVVGFAAATAHRGLRLIRLPSTTLAQADSGIGVKNGVNLFGKKNYLGTFDVPSAVINDERLLSTLSDRDWGCGFSEAVKVALIKDRPLFERIAVDAERIVARDLEVARPVIQRSCQLHFEHIVHGGDPFERDQARPLDFGHWAAHKLEEMTDFELRHGEAVAMGVALDVAYSERCGPLPAAEVDAVLDCLIRLGFGLYHPCMADRQLLDGLEEFREHLGGALAIPLLNRIGEATVVHDIDPAEVAACVERLATRNGHLQR